MLEPNPTAASPSVLDELVIEFVDDIAAATDALAAGELDAVVDLSGSDLSPAPTTSLPNGSDLLTFNTARIPLDVRAAIAAAIEVDELVSTALPFVGETERTGNRVRLPEQGGYADNGGDVVGLGPDEARELLGSAGFTFDGQGFAVRDGARLTLSLATTETNPWREAVAQVVADQLAAAGITVNVEPLPAADLFERLFPSDGSPPDFDLALFALVAPDDTLNGGDTYRTGGVNSTGFSDAEVDALITTIDAMLDEDERVELLDELDGLLWEQLPDIPLYTISSRSPSVTTSATSKQAATRRAPSPPSGSGASATDQRSPGSRRAVSGEAGECYVGSGRSRSSRSDSR